MAGTKSIILPGPQVPRRPPSLAMKWLSLFGFSLLASATSAFAGRHAALVVDGNTGRVISESAADEPRFPASLTKMMTLYVVFDLIEQGKLNYQTSIVFSDTSTRVQPTKLGIKEGGSITVLEAIKALITKSANDASVALAEHIAGAEPKFAALMTQTARRIGMSATTFKNAHGLPDAEQVTTARDMITLGLRLQDDFPKHYPLFSMREFNFRGDSHRNHNTMLLAYEGTDGIKTGYIGSSGFNLVANVRRNGKHVIGVVFGGPSAAARNQTMRNLLNIALVRASTVRTRQNVPVARGKTVPAPTAMARPSTAAIVQVAAAISAAPAVAQPIIVQKPSWQSVTEANPPAVPEVKVTRVRPLLVAPSPPNQAALPPKPVPALAPQRGAAPSTLEQQARQLTQASEPNLATAPTPQARPQMASANMGQVPAFRLNGPTPGQPSAAARLSITPDRSTSRSAPMPPSPTPKNNWPPFWLAHPNFWAPTPLKPLPPPAQESRYSVLASLASTARQPATSAMNSAVAKSIAWLPKPSRTEP